MNRVTALKMWVEEAKSAIMKRRTGQSDAGEAICKGALWTGPAKKGLMAVWSHTMCSAC